MVTMLSGLLLLLLLGAPVPQWMKRWPTDLAVPGSSSAQGETFLTVNGGFSLSFAH